MLYKTVMLDWAGTITIPLHEMMMGAAERIGFSPADMTSMLAGVSEYLEGTDSIIHRAERGEISDTELSAHLNSTHPNAGRFFDPNEPTFYYAQDRPEMVQLMKDARAAGIEVVIASNNLTCATSILEDRYLKTGLVDLVLNSADLGSRKPDRAFFAEAFKRAKCTASETLFLDDMKHNTDSAQELGLASILVGTDTSKAIEATRSALAL